MDINYIKKLDSIIRLTDKPDVQQNIKLIKDWEGKVCNFKLTNYGNNSVSLKEIVLFTGDIKLPGDTLLYGEGYSKLAQYGGTLDKPEDIGSLSDRAHYKMPQALGAWTVYNLAMLSSENGDNILMAFSSCNRFSGEFRFKKKVFEIVLDMEGLSINPGETFTLEEFFFSMGNNREELLAQLAEHIQINHPRLEAKEIPTGWCSWYCLGPSVTEKDIIDNMNAIKKEKIELKYIQIDDGYQSYMGDWLDQASSFSDMRKLCQTIKQGGFEPAVWVAPFIAEKNSKILNEHPEYFVKDENGEPLASDRFSFGGWRNGPWYMLDGTHIGTQEYLRHVFRTMREDWGVKYFKLDANMWGALHGGYHFDKSATKVEAYRRGMKAILQGACEDSFILGCNAPMWPSLGMVHGMRVTNDISRRWGSFKMVAKELFWRNWQHNKLWINDPDCILLENSKVKVMGPDGKSFIDKTTTITMDEFIFHATHIYASGGMILSGDDITKISDNKIKMLKKVLPPSGVAAKFDDTSFTVGRVQLKDRLMLCLFNWKDESDTLKVTLDGEFKVTDFWEGKELKDRPQKLVILDMPPHSARLLSCCQGTVL